MTDDDYVGRTLRDAATTGHVIGVILVLIFTLACLIAGITAISHMSVPDAIFTTLFVGYFTARILRRR